MNTKNQYDCFIKSRGYLPINILQARILLVFFAVCSRRKVALHGGSCQDAELREDLAKAACALLTLASGGDENNGSRPASGWLRRPGKLSKLDRDPEVVAFLNELLGKMYLNEARALAVQRFGPDRVPSRASIHRYLQRQRQAR